MRNATVLLALLMDGPSAHAGEPTLVRGDVATPARPGATSYSGHPLRPDQPYLVSSPHGTPVSYYYVWDPAGRWGGWVEESAVRRMEPLRVQLRVATQGSGVLTFPCPTRLDGERTEANVPTCSWVRALSRFGDRRKKLGDLAAYADAYRACLDELRGGMAGTSFEAALRSFETYRVVDTGGGTRRFDEVMSAYLAARAVTLCRLAKRLVPEQESQRLPAYGPDFLRDGAFWKREQTAAAPDLARAGRSELDGFARQLEARWERTHGGRLDSDRIALARARLIQARGTLEDLSIKGQAPGVKEFEALEASVEPLAGLIDRGALDNDRLTLFVLAELDGLLALALAGTLTASVEPKVLVPARFAGPEPVAMPLAGVNRYDRLVATPVVAVLRQGPLSKDRLDSQVWLDPPRQAQGR